MTEIDKGKLVADTTALDEFNRNVVEEFRANGGKVGGPFEGGNVLLLHTTGAKSGNKRLSPLAYLTIDGKMLIIGSYAGAPKDPAWVYNLRAHPSAHIEVGNDPGAVASALVTELGLLATMVGADGVVASGAGDLGPVLKVALDQP